MNRYDRKVFYKQKEAQRSLFYDHKELFRDKQWLADKYNL